jgi:hypothetical protein
LLHPKVRCFLDRLLATTNQASTQANMANYRMTLQGILSQDGLVSIYHGRIQNTSSTLAVRKFIHEDILYNQRLISDHGSTTHNNSHMEIYNILVPSTHWTSFLPLRLVGLLYFLAAQ